MCDFMIDERRDKVLSQERLLAGGSPKPSSPGKRFRDVARLGRERFLILLLSCGKIEAPGETKILMMNDIQVENHETRQHQRTTIYGS
jgi:hypothetical protein